MGQIPQPPHARVTALYDDRHGSPLLTCAALALLPSWFTQSCAGATGLRVDQA